MKKYFLFFLFIFISFYNSFCFVREFVDSVKVVRVNSIKQKIKNFNTIFLSGDVEVLVDHKIHIWADKVEIDKEKQFLVAEKIGTKSVVIENDYFLILADKFFLDLDKKTGYADNIRVHVDEGYLIASRAEKLEENTWRMEDIIFTPCDAPVPHWSIYASSAQLSSNYLIRLTGVIFKTGSFPFFILPYMVLPIQKRSKSGFLLPRFSFDEELGFGVRQEFYWSITPRCDSTIGIDWKEKKGLAFVDEFRWVRSPESFTLLNSQYALEKNAFIKKKDRILKATDKRYWIEGKDFRKFNKIIKSDLNSLIRIDFGTDKKIGYQFFDKLENLDDTFYNSWILRSNKEYNVFNLMFNSVKTIRSQFSKLTNAEEEENIINLLASGPDKIDEKDIFSKKKELEDKVVISIFPHLEWNKAYKHFKDFINYKHTIFFDHVVSRERKSEKFYVNSRVVEQNDITPLAKADSFRFFYNGVLNYDLMFNDQILQFYLEPNLQIRSNLKNRSIKTRKNAWESKIFSGGIFRSFLHGGIDWFFPEIAFENQNYSYFFQPCLSWEFIPKFKQDHWYNSDVWDRVYPTNQLSINFKNNWDINNLLIDFNIKQALDFYNVSDRFYLERSPQEKHLLPLNLEFGLNGQVLNIFLSQLYNWKNFQLLESQIDFLFSLNKFNLSLSTIYQHEKIQNTQSLFSDIPHFLLFGFSVPVLKNATISYDGYFYSQKQFMLFPFEGLRPLHHSIKLNYEGHCWGISLGFEEKRYREYGNWKREKAFTFFVKLESLGSFTRRFRRPKWLSD